MSSSFWLLEVESRDFSQAEKERTAWKAEQNLKMTTFFTQNDNLKELSFCEFAQHHVTQLPTAKN